MGAGGQIRKCKLGGIVNESDVANIVDVVVSIKEIDPWLCRHPLVAARPP